MADDSLVKSLGSHNCSMPFLWWKLSGGHKCVFFKNLHASCPFLYIHLHASTSHLSYLWFFSTFLSSSFLARTLATAWKFSCLVSLGYFSFRKSGGPASPLTVPHIGHIFHIRVYIYTTTPNLLNVRITTTGQNMSHVTSGEIFRCWATNRCQWLSVTLISLGAVSFMPIRQWVISPQTLILLPALSAHVQY